MITKFVNRKLELNFFNERHRNKGHEFIPVYGRRRVGKTELLFNFIKDKKAVYFLSTSGTKKDNIEKFKAAAKHIMDLDFIKDDWEDIFKYLAGKVKNRLIIVIDEFPYLLETERGLSSIFQRIIDLYLKNSSIFLILCGSSLSMMHKEVLDYRAPLYGRRTGQAEIKSLEFKDVIKFFKKPFEETVGIYSICGGVPAYLREFLEDKPLKFLIDEKIMSKSSFLREEVPFILREEFRDPRVYLTILSSLSLGHRKLGEIMNHCGFKDKTSITPYLRNLESLQYIRREISITEKVNSKKGLYFINDNFFNFWFRVVRKNIELFDRNIKFDENIIQEFEHITSFVFEDICRQFILEYMGNLFDEVGRQWGKTKYGEKGKNTYEIDIAALNEKTKEILFGECKWQENVNSGEVVKELAEKTKNVDWENEKRKESYAVFAKSFSKRIGEFDGKKVYCFDLKDLEKVFTK